MHACLCRLMGLGFQIVLIVLFVSESENLFIRMGIDFCIIFFFLIKPTNTSVFAIHHCKNYEYNPQAFKMRSFEMTLIGIVVDSYVT